MSKVTYNHTYIHIYLSFLTHHYFIQHIYDNILSSIIELEINMASSIYANQPSSPMVTSSTSIPTEEIGYSPPPNTNRRGGFGNKLRNLFRRNSPSPNRTTSSERRPPPSTISVRETSSSPTSGKSSTEAPHLRAPTVNWAFGKKKSKSPATASTPTTSKKKIKASRKTNESSTPPLEISSPIYRQEIQSSIQGQHFTPRTPELVHSSTTGLHSSSTYEPTTRGFRDYAIIDQTQSYQQVSTLVIISIVVISKEIFSYFRSFFLFLFVNNMYYYFTNNNKNQLFVDLIF